MALGSMEPPASDRKAPAGCGCDPDHDQRPFLVSKSIEPEHYMKVVEHKVRQRVLIALSYMTVDEPVSIMALADELGMGYHQLNYQLKTHLRPFWEVRCEKKVRGAHQIFIAPPHRDVIYFLLGARSHLHIIDPLAGIFGKISKVGTRCDSCPPEQVQKCLMHIKENPCMPQSQHLIEYRRSILQANRRPTPHMPIDYFLICTVMKNLTQEVCVLDIHCKEIYATLADRYLDREAYR